MEKLQNEGVLLVQQKKEWGEILTGFETKNKYVIINPSGEQLYWVGEESSFLSRWFLKNLRPFTLHILSPQGNLVLKLVRPFRLFLSELSVFDSTDRFLGEIKQKFSFFSRKFVVKDATGRELYEIFGPFLHPWTFRILRNGEEVGKISKKWSGLGQELFTRADNFNIVFPPGIDGEQKGVLLGALFLIDMLFFEER
ncbi:MAG: scramblase [Candidatus Omnitrophica bacterium 4484_70.2]|nr:MAG: scramblase [Candidatus Omnitrophica bacterium 4484_70.2]